MWKRLMDQETIWKSTQEATKVRTIKDQSFRSEEPPDIKTDPKVLTR